jgi:hypothetical protein
MRSGNKPRRRAAAETVQAPSSLEPLSADNQSGMQLPLGPLEEPAEILVRFSTDEPEAAAEPLPEVEAVADPVAELLAEPGAAAPSAATTADFSAEPSAYEPAESGPVEDASLLRRLARIHLRTGSLTTARAQLESLAGRNLLDTTGTLDLAEARWRTGDLHGAGEAAGAYLAANGDEALGFVIAAEAASLGNHDVEARRHMEQALLRTLTSLDSIFAGIPRKAMLAESGWETTPAPEKTPAAESPKAAAPASEPAPEPEAKPAEPAAAEPEPAAEPEVKAAAVPAGAVEAAAEAEPEPTPTALIPEASGTPTTEPSTADAATQPLVDPGRAQADTEIAAGMALLETGDALLAALHFGVALRMTPESAQSVLGAIGDRHDLALELVRGDALRMQGHERDAGQAYQSVASALNGARTAAESAAESPAEPAAESPAEAAAEVPAEHAQSPAEPAAESPAEAAAEVPAEHAQSPAEPAAESPAEPAAIIPTDARRESEGPEPRPPEPAPPISWLD